MKSLEYLESKKKFKEANQGYYFYLYIEEVKTYGKIVELECAIQQWEDERNRETFMDHEIDSFIKNEESEIDKLMKS